jgi:hypothetical protein
MDASIIAALAALAGAAIGGLTSFVSSWWTQRAQAKAQWRAQIQLRRQELYKEFIGDASKLFVHALQNDADKARRFHLDGALCGGEQNARRFGTPQQGGPAERNAFPFTLAIFGATNPLDNPLHAVPTLNDPGSIVELGHDTSVFVVGFEFVAFALSERHAVRPLFGLFQDLAIASQ